MTSFGAPIFRVGSLARRRPPVPQPPATVLPAIRPTTAPAAATGTPPPATTGTGSYPQIQLQGGKLDFNNLIQSYQGQQDKANAANESRYQGILSTLKGQGAASKNEITRGGEEERGGISQDLISRGLFGTSILDSLRNNSFDRESRQKQAVDESVADRTAGVMERRTDQGPDSGMFAQLLSQAAGGLGQTQGANAGSNPGQSFSFGGINQAALQRPGFGGAGGSGSGGTMGGPTFGGGGGGGGPTMGGVETFTGGRGGGAQVQGGLPINDDLLLGTRNVERQGLIYDMNNPNTPIARRSSYRGGYQAGQGLARGMR